MTKTVKVMFDGVQLISPIVNDHPIEFPVSTFAEFKPYCGAGDGLGNTLVPETILFLKVTPACYIHDIDFEIADPTWEAFHAANARFLTNIVSIVHTRSKSFIMKYLRNYRAVSYFNAVDTAGVYPFWNLKREQGHEIPLTALRYAGRIT